MSQRFANLPDCGLLAGMPSFTLNDVAQMRIETISFFLLVVLISAWLLKALWNVLSRDFPALPTIRFKHALAIFTVSGLFFYVVLTMISGARELMTPGAWEKDGATYRLGDSAAQLPTESTRRLALQNLFTHLQAYAEQHDGSLPPKRFASGIPKAIWIAADGLGMPFDYFAFGKLGESESERIIACEPSSVGQQRLVLFGDGRIETLHWKIVREMTIALITFEEDNDAMPTSLYELYPEYMDSDPTSARGERYWYFKAKDGSLHEWLYFPEARQLSSNGIATENNDKPICLASPLGCGREGHCLFHHRQRAGHEIR